MKSRTSFFDKTVFKKDITRFAPAWVLYTLCLLMGMILIRQNGSPISFHNNFQELLTLMCTINFCYAILNAQLLFGDLYNARMSNALHALPVRREAFFISHVAAGIAYSLVPTLIAAPLALVLGIGSPVEQGWQIPLLWVACTNLQYIFFFGVAVFAALCTGNRLGQAVIYGLINFASVIAFLLVDTIYTPLLYGLRTIEESFMFFSPIMSISEFRFLSIERQWDRSNPKEEILVRAWFELDGAVWGYLAVCAAIGVALIVAACLLYRKRHLECAGDLLAVKCLEPVFMVAYPIVVAAVCYFIADDLFSGGIFYLVVGLCVGFFTGRMLLERSLRVFRPRAFIGLAVLAVGFGLTMLVTWLDPMGLVTWKPEVNEVANVQVWSGHYSLYRSVKLEEPAEIEDILRVHDIALENRNVEEEYNQEILATTQEFSSRTYYPQPISIQYTLKDGTVKTRYYTVDTRYEARELLNPYFSSLEAVFWEAERLYGVEEMLANVDSIIVNNGSSEGQKEILDQSGVNGLLDAIRADCDAGLMTQSYNFRPDPEMVSVFWLDLKVPAGALEAKADPEAAETVAVYAAEGVDYNYWSCNIYADSVNTVRWLYEHGYESAVFGEEGVKIPDSVADIVKG